MENRRASYRFRVQPGCQQATLVRREGANLAVELVDESATGVLIAFTELVPVEIGETVWLQNAAGWREAEVCRIDARKRMAGLTNLREINSELPAVGTDQSASKVAVCSPSNSDNLKKGISLVAAIALGGAALLLTLRMINTGGAMPIVRSHTRPTETSQKRFIVRRNQPSTAKPLDGNRKPLDATATVRDPDSLLRTAAGSPDGSPDGGDSVESQVNRFMQEKLDDLQKVQQMIEQNAMQVSPEQTAAIESFVRLLERTSSPEFATVQDAHRAVFANMGPDQRRQFKAFQALDDDSDSRSQE